MKRIGLMLMLVVCVAGMVGCADGYKNKVQTGPAIAGAGEKPMMLVRATKGVFGGSFEARITGGSVKADSIRASDSQPSGKWLEVLKPDLETENFAALTDAATAQIKDGLLAMSKEHTVYGQTVLLPIVREIMTPAQLIASAAPILVGDKVMMQLPNGMTFQGQSVLGPTQWATLVGQLMTGLADLATAIKAPATQPADKPAGPVAPVE